MMIDNLINFVQDIYQTRGVIPLHAPSFSGNEKSYVMQTLESTFVSSVGQYVNDFEANIEGYIGCNKAVATVTGTAALHTALYMADIQAGDLVITQALTFVATCNALHYLGAQPIFVDVSKISLSLCPLAVAEYLDEYAMMNADGQCIHKKSGKKIKALMPMHTFGHPADLDALLLLCKKWKLLLIEDAAEALGSFYKGRHVASLGDFSALSFNGNKIITSGGGGMVICRDENAAKRARHITTTAKVPHPYEFNHDEVGFNYRLPNLNAALACAQLEQLPQKLKSKRQLAAQYIDFFSNSEYRIVKEPEYAQSNYWLNAVICPSTAIRDECLKISNAQQVMTRPVWTLMHHLPMFSHAEKGLLPVSQWLASHLLCLPSSPIGEYSE